MSTAFGDRVRPTKDLNRRSVLSLEALIEHLQGRAPAIPKEFSWVGDLEHLNRRQFADELVGRLGMATRGGDFDALEQWLYEWKVASEVDRDAGLRRALISATRRRESRR